MTGSIVTAPTATSHWQKLVHEAQQTAGIELDEQLESYLVFLLMRFTGDVHMAARVMALDYLEGMLAAGRERHERLRDVGDHCLLVSGLFPRRAERRRVKVSYFVRLGRAAYADLGARLEAGLAELYHDLARGFVALMDTLQAVRRMGAEPALEPLQALELWADTGSTEALQSVTTHTGSVPVVLPEGRSKPH